MNARAVKKHLTEAGYDVRKIRVRVESRGYSDTYIKVKLFERSDRVSGFFCKAASGASSNR